jgi:hypothetical protein
LLSQVSKILERLIFRQVSSFIKDSLYDIQHVFRCIGHVLLNFWMCFTISVALLILAMKLIFFILILLKLLTPYLTANSCLN